MNLDFQTIAAILFIGLMTYFLVRNKEKLQIQKIAFPLVYFVMYRSRFGIKFMEKVSSKIPRILKWAAYAGVFVGFLSMAFISYSLVYNLVRMVTTPAATAGVALVLPFKIKGSFYVPFFYWIISIFILAVVHEFSHGVVARAYNVRIKSSGFAFLGIIAPILPAAFVEPREEELKKKSAAARLSVFAAGPFSNIIFAAFVAFLFWILFTPLASAVFQPDGVQVWGYVKGENMTFPAEQANITKGELITSINGAEILTVENFTDFLNSTSPGQPISILTNRTTYNVNLANDPEDGNKSYLGVYVRQHSVISEGFREKYGNIITSSLVWVIGLFYWLYILNLGIGLFNLVPLGPIDGGRMLRVALEKYLRQDIALKVWKFTGTLFLFIIVASILFAFIK